MEVDLSVPGYECNSPVALRDFDRLIFGYRLIQTALSGEAALSWEAALSGEVTLSIPGYESNSQIAPSDFNRLMSVYRLVQTASHRDTVLIRPLHIGIPPYIGNTALTPPSGYRLMGGSLLYCVPDGLVG